jgi:hypothetical protein
MVERRFVGRVLAVLAGSAIGFVAPSALAQAYRDGPPPQHRIVYRDLTLFRWNPLGLISDARITYRLRLYESQKLAFRDNFLGIGIAPALSGAFLRGGPMLEFQPASFLQLWGIYEFVGYFGAFNFLQSYPTADAARVNYSDTELERRGDLAKGDPAKNYSTTGTQVLFGANLQFKFGPVVVRDQIRFGRANMDLRAGDRAYYDIFYDLLSGNRGFWMSNDADLLYQALDSRLTLGLRYTAGQAFYRPEHFGPGDDQNNGPQSIHRAGPIAAWTFKQPDGAAIEPTVLLVLNWWLKSPYRTGQDVSQGVPYIVAALNITGDLLPTKKPAPSTAEPAKAAPPPADPPKNAPPTSTEPTPTGEPLPPNTTPAPT